MGKATSRRLAASAVVTLLCAISVRLVRGSYKPYAPAAPAYRQSGPADAPIVLTEFSDFQCPGCAAAVETIKKL
ncbi:MAG: thioredoxin domain-containing protein, partial [Elusimicrobia bacterium]|nr:thioredoxin domain-containing protein [Elusimicrobiota bacterium]